MTGTMPGTSGDAAWSAGLDLSLTASGIALPDGRCGKVGRDGITGLSVVEQMEVLDGLARQITDRVFGAAPKTEQELVVVVEALDMANAYGGQIERTILWWEVVRGLLGYGFRVATPTSGQVKKYATGNGNAKKGEVQDAVTRQWPQFDHRGDDNMSDASAMCALGLALSGHPLTDLPKTHTGVLAAVRYVTDRPPAKKTKKR